MGRFASTAALVLFITASAVVRVGAQPVVTHDLASMSSIPVGESKAHTDAPVEFLDDGQVVGQPAGPAPTPGHTGIRAMIKDLGSDVTHLPSRENLFWAGVGGGLALAVHPADDNVNRSMVGNDFAHSFFKPGAVLGQTGTLLAAAVSVYAVGRLKDEPKVSHMGMDLLESLAVSEGITQVLKYSTRRERPDGSGANSFPSGHAADTFAFATALERHLGWRGAVPAYIFSSYVAISRLPANRHWLSDAVFGSSVGIIAGRTVTRHGRDFPVTVTAVPGGGVAVMYVRRQ
jgi:hypothetical protein